MFLTLMWIAVAAGMVTVITAAMKVQKTLVCQGYDVNITGAEQDKLFTSEEQIIKLLKAATKGEITGQRLSEFDLPGIEDLLEQSAWVYNAELYFDNLDRLRVNVIERKPLARIFTNLGQSFYIDEAGKYIPLSEKISLDVPVFTGYPSKKILNAADSLLVQNVIATASFINEDPFWSSQVSQIDINNCGPDCWDMEMVPVVGNHRVQLGDGSDVASKFHRLYLFYDQVLKRKGFDKYRKIDVQYEGQVLGIKDAHTKIDSLQLRKNIETLLAQSREANELIEETPNIGLSRYVLDSASASDILDVNAEPEMPEAKPAAPVTTVTEKKPEVIKRETKPAVARTPERTGGEKKAEPKKEMKKAEVKKPEVKKETGNNVKKTAGKETKPVVKKATDKRETKPAAVKKEVKKPEPKKEVKKAEVKKSPVKKEATKTEPAKKPATPQKPKAASKTTTKKTN